mgnify:CR=1 FL=1
MPYALSFLDKSPIHGGESAGDALKRTLALARKAEQAGFRRFWIAEHHNAPGLASSSPARAYRVACSTTRTTAGG